MKIRINVGLQKSNEKNVEKGEKMSTLDEILKEINKAKSIVILTHKNPDGDAIGSSLAMYQCLKKLEKNVDMIIPEIPRAFKILPCIDEVKKESDIKNYDLAISLDCASIKLLNGWLNYFDDANERIVIDHHSSNSMFGDLNYVDPSSPACAQVLYEIFKYYKFEINNDIGSCIMTGIITDTGGFQYSNVSTETFEITSELLSNGVNVSKLYKKMLENHSRASFELKKIANDRLEFLEDGKVTFTYITKEDEERVNAEVGDYDGIVNEGRNIEGVEVSIFIHEIDEGLKASLRANDYVNVADVCMMFGGGGHVRAAGANMTGTIEEIKEKLLKEVKRQLK